MRTSRPRKRKKSEVAYQDDNGVLYPVFVDKYFFQRKNTTVMLVAFHPGQQALGLNVLTGPKSQDLGSVKFGVLEITINQLKDLNFKLIERA